MNIVHAFLGALAIFENCQSIHMEQLNFHCTDFQKNLYLRSFKKSVEKIKDALKSDRLTGHLHEDLCAFMTSSSSMISVSGHSCRENVETHFMFDISFSNILR